ncbi:MAG: DUF488 domain-containing protein [Lentisphaerae bacterium]|nr:DUF488 domain-containing protein [Lentisphaerota bacterium]
MGIHLKRSYDPPAAADGTRILVDRLWPRGLAKATAGIDLWLKDIAPTTALRQWFNHDPAKWPEFEERYRAELAGHPALDDLRRRARQGPITLVYASRDQDHNQAVVLKRLIDSAP